MPPRIQRMLGVDDGDGVVPGVNEVETVMVAVLEVVTPAATLPTGVPEKVFSGVDVPVTVAVFVSEKDADTVLVTVPTGDCVRAAVKLAEKDLLTDTPEDTAGVWLAVMTTGTVSVGVPDDDTPIVTLAVAAAVGEAGRVTDAVGVPVLDDDAARVKELVAVLVLDALRVADRVGAEDIDADAPKEGVTVVDRVAVLDGVACA